MEERVFLHFSSLSLFFKQNTTCQLAGEALEALIFLFESSVAKGGTGKERYYFTYIPSQVSSQLLVTSGIPLGSIWDP